MLAKLRLTASPQNEPPHNPDKGKRASLDAEKARAVRLRKRKPVKSDSQVDKRYSVPDLRQPGVFSVPPLPYKGADVSVYTRSVSMPVTTNTASPTAQSPPDPVPPFPHRASTITRREIKRTLIDRPVVLPDSPIRPERPPPFETQSPAPPKQKSLSFNAGPPVGRRPRAPIDPNRDPRRSSTGKLKKVGSSSPPSDSNGFPLDVQRRFSYLASNPMGPTLEDMQAVSIHATRIPEFSSAYDSKVPSPSVQVTIVDQLPHQKAAASPTRLLSMKSAPAIRRKSLAPVAEISETRTLNEEFLLDQTEVLSYLQNDFYQPPEVTSPPRPPAIANDVPITPPYTNPSFPRTSADENAFIDDLVSEFPNLLAKNAFIDDLISEFPYLLGKEDSFSVFETEPLHPHQTRDLYGLGLTPDGSSISSSGTRAIVPEFPPSPPRSEGRPSSEQYTQAMLDELAAESDSIRSVVDAINKASSRRSSFDSSDDETDFGEEFEDDQVSVFESRPGTALSFETDADSIFKYSAPILRSGFSSYPGLDFARPLVRSPSQATRSSFLDDGEIAEILAEQKRSKPELAPIVTTPISPGQYGPRIQRHHHLRGKGKLSSPSAARGGLDAVKPTLVKVVEEEMVEYTPVEEGEDKGWIRQRRVSRAGEWVVVERELIKGGAI
jgi:hypothetical protein